MPKPYTPNDAWSRRAADEGYRARSVYKLKELDERFRLIKPGMTVVDLGAAPGSWLQYARENVGQKGTVIGIDLQEIDPIEGVRTHVANITNPEKIAEVLKREKIEQVDLLLSDLAPSTSGIKDVDQWRSIELSQSVLEIARRFLKPAGRCVIKVLRGADFDEFLRQTKTKWADVRTARVKASRDRSKEIYLLLRKPS